MPIVGLGPASHDVLSDVSANDHHAQGHPVISHSDTTATGAELNTLTGGGDTTLHDHTLLDLIRIAEIESLG